MPSGDMDPSFHIPDRAIGEYLGIMICLVIVTGGDFVAHPTRLIMTIKHNTRHIPASVSH
jgi:hypothetical protein